eukprot:TRINITY_DN25917_c0_g1_i1.p2 TRINITY_DN25917_c0_g1~~TRINITY_DN25917_c0_g1_i1.p2  ORF type:complete len:177 (+),score=35.42 TRINITY_DN25917_c0_g1_i1:2-532(+)
MNKWLWSDAAGGYQAYNTSTRAAITNRVFVLAFPLWCAGDGCADHAQQQAMASTLQAPDLLTPYGVRSTSSLDPRYSNANVIVPYSNWRGPVWINSNSVLAYGLRSAGLQDLAVHLAVNVTRTLANDLRDSGTWHECYHSETGKGLAAPGFLSWNTLGASLLPDVIAGRDPFSLHL